MDCVEGARLEYFGRNHVSVSHVCQVPYDTETLKGWNSSVHRKGIIYEWLLGWLVVSPVENDRTILPTRTHAVPDEIYQGKDILQGLPKWIYYAVADTGLFLVLVLGVYSVTGGGLAKIRQKGHTWWEINKYRYCMGEISCWRNDRYRFFRSFSRNVSGKAKNTLEVIPMWMLTVNAVIKKSACPYWLLVIWYDLVKIINVIMLNVISQITILEPWVSPPFRSHSRIIKKISSH
jgi:hypothetical protein